MLAKRINEFFGERKWSTFNGFGIEEFAEILESVLHDLGYQYTVSSVMAKWGERVMLGSYCNPLLFNIGNIEIRLTPAYADPMTRLVFSIMSSKSVLNDMRRVSVVTISPINNETKPMIGSIMSELVCRLPHPPWKINHHPRFRSSPLLALRVKKMWQSWLNM
jgi:hypothetical protein